MEEDRSKLGTHVFVSHTFRDKESVRAIASALKVAGGDVWLDEWKLTPGDSLPGTISAALERFDTFVLVWSLNAANSKWVTSELNAALARRVEENNCRIVPIILDDTPLPGLLRHLYFLDGRTEKPLQIAKKVLGLDSDRALRIAVQQTLNDLHFEEFWGVGVLVGCPKCGAPVERIRAGEWCDEQRDDVYRGAECLDCGWSDASEI